MSDRLLVFTASDSSRSTRGREVLVKLMGDPRQDQGELMQGSPLYRYRELTLPLMLVHGREDLRVDFEHTRRLVRMLNLNQRTPVVLAFPGEAHGLANPAALDVAWSGVAGFLQKHLGTVSGGVAGGRVVDVDAGATALGAAPTSTAAPVVLDLP